MHTFEQIEEVAKQMFCSEGPACWFWESETRKADYRQAARWHLEQVDQLRKDRIRVAFVTVGTLDREIAKIQRTTALLLINDTAPAVFKAPTAQEITTYKEPPVSPKIAADIQHREDQEYNRRHWKDARRKRGDKR
jgi:hypothetical protein